MAADQHRAGFLDGAPPSEAAQQMFADDVADVGYVMNLTRLWAHVPEAHRRWTELTVLAADLAGLDLRRKGVVVTAMAATLGDAYCSLAWGTRLAQVAGEEVARAVLSGAPLDDPVEHALAAWARAVVRDPNRTSPDDVQALRDAGLDERQVVGLTLYVALRQAFSTVNDALGAAPDAELLRAAPPVVREAVGYGRPAAG
ncbi:carboxymuconolactone decarboxylase family protein [Desertihabitans aurantiacus]|uniref:carboxymuconolactone decarboxylase family protein n=1 Tax=Desertihabitans aurantiacus TaxID=2282477 RepID=UPI000DF72933|nr:hypothetical protein [Desertihabitans aurantiacus]